MGNGTNSSSWQDDSDPFWYSPRMKPRVLCRAREMGNLKTLITNTIIVESGREDVATVAIPPRNIRELAGALVEEWGNIWQQELANLVQSMRWCTAVLNAAGGHTRYRLLLLIPPFVQGHIIKFMLVTCLWNLFSLCLSCWILCSYLHMLNLRKINAVDSERTFIFLLGLDTVQ